MRYIKHLLKALAVMLPLAVLCGCTAAAVECGVGEDNTATLSYSIDIERGDIAAADWAKVSGILNTIGQHWQGAGFHIKDNKTDENLSLTAVMEKKEKNREKAFDALLDMMRAETSSFIGVSGDYSGSYFSDEYYLSAACNFTGIIPKDNIDALPYNIKADVLSILDKSSIEISILLPGKVIETSGEKVKGGCKISAGFSEPAEVYIRTRLDNTDNTAAYNDMLQTRDLYKILIIAGGGAAVLFLVAFIVLLALRGKAARLDRLAVQSNMGPAEVIEIPSQIDMEK